MTDFHFVVSDMENIYQVDGGNRKFFGCAICHKDFTTKGHLDDHMKAVHEEVKYKCDICKVNLTTKVALKNHILIHDENALKLESLAIRQRSNISA